jgi:hypothetical protein
MIGERVQPDSLIEQRDTIHGDRVRRGKTGVTAVSGSASASCRLPSVVDVAEVGPSMRGVGSSCGD